MPGNAGVAIGKTEIRLIELTDRFKEYGSAVTGDKTMSPAPAGQSLKGEIATSRFSVGPHTHARQAIMRRAARFWMAVTLPVAALVIGGLVYDTRLLFIAAAMIFILFPTLLFIGWYGILTRPWAVASLFPQEVTLARDNELTVDYHPLPGQDTVPPADLVIPAKSITDCQFWGHNLIVSYGNRCELIIPLSAFADPAEAAAFQRRLESPRRSTTDF